MAGGHLSEYVSKAEKGEVHDAGEEFLCKPVCVDPPQRGVLNRSLRHLETGDLLYRP